MTQGLREILPFLPSFSLVSDEREHCDRVSARLTDCTAATGFASWINTPGADYSPYMVIID